jgi:hypothetical protein
MASRRNSHEPTAPLPTSERKALSAGIAFALACAAALSAPTLYELARLIRYPAQLAWLLPAAFDGYAGTSIWIGRRIARSHPAAKSARRNARLALGLTILCNGLYHLLALAGTSLPEALRITVLVAVSSLPPLIVDRLLHLNAIANGNDLPETAAPAARESTRKQAPVSAPTLPATPVSQTASLPPQGGNQPPALPPAASAPTRKPTGNQTGSSGGNVVAFRGNGRRSSPNWAELALPLWFEHIEATHAEPNATELAALLRQAHPTLAPAMPKTDRSERNIRAVTEELVKKAARAAAEREREDEAS